MNDPGGCAPSVKRSVFHRSMQALILVLATGYFVFCVWNSAWLEPLPIQRYYVLTLILCVFGMVAFACGRLSFALFLSGTLFFGLKFIAVMKERYMESALMPADFIYYVHDSLIDTLAQYPQLIKLIVGICIAALLLPWLIWRFDIRLLPKLRCWWPHSAVRLLGVFTFALGILWTLQPAGPFATVYETTLWSRISDGTNLTNFFVNIQSLRPRLPAMSDAATAQRLWGDTATKEKPVIGTISTRPDIVQVLEESTFDPTILTACTRPECKVALFQPDQHTVASGPLRSHTFGGATWLGEFAMLSGMPHKIFGPAGVYAPFVLAPRLRESLPLHLRQLGYLTIAVYPVGGNFLDARNAYRSYGFDKFYDVHDLGLKEWQSTDSEIFAAAKKVYDVNRKSGQPIFLVILTLEQHGPHNSTPLTDLPEPFKQGLKADLTADEDLNLSTYLSRLSASNAGMKQLEQDFLHRPQPTVLMHFGDHQPSFNGLIGKMAHKLPVSLEPYANTVTYFMLKSNFDSPALPQYPVTDIAYIPSMVLRAARLPEGSYFTALARLQTLCNGLYIDCKNEALLKSYHAWTFNNLQVYK